MKNISKIHHIYKCHIRNLIISMVSVDTTSSNVSLPLKMDLQVGRTVSADIFCAEITAGKSQRLKEITTAVGKFKHEF
jgi:hypothetical protein